MSDETDALAKGALLALPHLGKFVDLFLSIVSSVDDGRVSAEEYLAMSKRGLTEAAEAEMRAELK